MKAFPLSAVRLTGGPTQHAQRLGQRYLLGLGGRPAAGPLPAGRGLIPVGPSYGNWESAGLEGHTAGHYLSGLAKMYAATGDEELKQRLDHVVAVLARCQELIGTGYVGGIAHSARLWAQIRAGDIVSDGFGLNGRWVPLYNLHKVLAGLLDANRHAGSELALDVAVRLAEWWLDLVGELSETQFQTMVATEFGGLNEVFADLGGSTGDPRYTAMAHRFTQPWLVAPVMAGRDELTGLHANTQIPQIVGVARIGSAERSAAHLDAARFFWDRVVHHRSVSIGGNSVREYFNDVADFERLILDREGPESCNTYNMAKLTAALYEEDDDARLIDYYERALFNHILSIQHPETGDWCISARCGRITTGSTRASTSASGAVSERASRATPPTASWPTPATPPTCTSTCSCPAAHLARAGAHGAPAHRLPGRRPDRARDRDSPVGSADPPDPRAPLVRRAGDVRGQRSGHGTRRCCRLPLPPPDLAAGRQGLDGLRHAAAHRGPTGR